MDFKLFLILFLFQYVSTLEYHLIKSDGNISTINSSKNVMDNPPIDTVAVMIYENNINKTGWANLELKTFRGPTQESQAYFAGVLEGFITGDLIDMNFKNTIEGLCVDSKIFCQSLKEFIENNKKFTQRMIKENLLSDYWHQLDLIYKQLEGMQRGYDLWRIKNNRPINTTESYYFSEIFALNIASDLDELKNIVIPGSKSPPSDHCSAIIKPLTDGSDLFVAHNTWSYYNNMIRILKKYDFAFVYKRSFLNGRIPGYAVSFSSYPGVINSVDDFYVLSSGLVVQETTNHDYNLSLYKEIKADKMIFEFARNVIANRLANSGEEWKGLFGEYNSGTYNNQFMIVDYKRFNRGTKVSELSNGLLWIVEQMPTMIRAEDVTHVIREQGYWASYNVPYFKDQFIKSGNADMAQKYGTYYSYNETARAKIFRREQSSITDMKKLYALMRYNDFQNDPLSRCQVYNQTCSPPYSADLSIAARNDLNKPNGKYPIHSWTHRLEGAIDAKMTKFSMVPNLEMLAVSGPTDRKQTPFQWSKSDIQMKHLGHPDLFNFKPIYAKWYPNSYEMANDV